MPDPTDPRSARGHQPQRRYVPADWVEDDPGVRSTFGPPASDTAPWWRLQPGVKDGDRFVRPSTLHGATCRAWPPGRHPPDWIHVNRLQARTLLTRPDEVRPCPRCQPTLKL
jgi:hypothetical protein